jgi:hypothetical protein
MATRGWVAVNVFWLVNQQGQEEDFKLVSPFLQPPDLQLCPHSTAIPAKNAEKSPDPIHVSNKKGN